MSNTQELSFTEKMVTTFAIIGGLIAFALALTKCDSKSNNLSLDPNLQSPEASISSPIDAQSPTPSTSQNEVISLENDNEEYEALLDSLRKELTQKEATIAKLKNTLKNTPKQALPETPTQEEPSVATQPIEVPKTPTGPTTEELQAKILSLSSEFTKLETESITLKEKLAALQNKNTEIARNSSIREQELNKRIKELSANLKQGEAKSILKSEIAKVDAQWKKQIDKLKVSHELDKAKATNALKSRIADLQVAIRKEKAQKVFADSQEDLAPSAKSLIAQLDNHQGNSPEALAQLYSSLNGKLSAQPILSVQFPSGSSTVSNEYKAQISELLKSSGANSYFVAVGYADSSGSASQNKSLSSKRATNVAQVIKPSLSKNQFTQAFYLGQTERFGAPENNRIVEIWEIKQ